MSRWWVCFCMLPSCHRYDPPRYDLGCSNNIPSNYTIFIIILYMCHSNHNIIICYIPGENHPLSVVLLVHREDATTVCAVLSFHDVTPEDYGVYTCFLQNKWGVTNTSILLRPPGECSRILPVYRHVGLLYTHDVTRTPTPTPVYKLWYCGNWAGSYQ